ncbi:MAG: D-cysteine desulfhydrase family protein [bacterium]
MFYELPKSIKLAHLPTPIEKLEKLSLLFEGPQIYIKRDDLTGMVLSGNKIRKLEFLLAEALEQECDLLITCGNYQSNHARTTAVAAAKLRLKCHLVLRNTMGGTINGNLFLNRLLGAEIKYITPEEYLSVDEIMAELANELKSKGHRPYIIPEGGSNEMGALGYLKAVDEIAEQLKSMKLQIHHIVTAVGSGGTYAGLLLGKFLFDLSAEIHGINICDDESFFVNKIHGILKKAQKRFNLEVNLSKKDIKIIDGYVGKGYGLSSQEEIDMIKRVSLAEGIILDPVYTGKAMVGLADKIRQGKFKPEENILFIHTGGIFGLFPKRTLFF